MSMGQQQVSEKTTNHNELTACLWKPQLWLPLWYLQTLLVKEPAAYLCEKKHKSQWNSSMFLKYLEISMSFMKEKNITNINEQAGRCWKTLTNANEPSANFWKIITKINESAANSWKQKHKYQWASSKFSENISNDVKVSEKKFANLNEAAECFSGEEKLHKHEQG